MAYVDYSDNPSSRAQRLDRYYHQLKERGLLSLTSSFLGHVQMQEFLTLLKGTAFNICQDSESAAAVANFVRDDDNNFGNGKEGLSLADRVFAYEPLPDGMSQPHMRLLKIKPRDWDGRIHCSLKTYSLQNLPSYDALSYCWGKGKPDVSISCNGSNLIITRTVACAISRLRLLGCRYIWVDALCINQNDLHERESQVRIMQRIYAEAASVWVWLGGQQFHEASGYASGSCFKTLREYACLSATELERPSKRPTAYKDRVEEQRRREADPFTIEFAQLLRMAWFDRIWCVQEVAVASKVVIVCGPDLIDWPTFFKGLSNITQALRNCGRNFGAIQQESLISQRLRTLVTQERPMAGETAPDYLLRLLTKFRSRQATDPRDKVYALIGMVQRSMGECTLGISYHHDVVEVYKRTAIYLIRDSHCLDVLEACASTRPRANSSQMPSWAPDWRSDFGAPRLFKDRFQYGSTQFTSAANRPSAVLCRQNNQLLGLRGIIIDTISRVGKLLPLLRMRGGHHDFREYLAGWFFKSRYNVDLTSYQGKTMDVFLNAMDSYECNEQSKASDRRVGVILPWLDSKAGDKEIKPNLGRKVREMMKARPEDFERQAGERLKFIIKQIKIFSEWNEIAGRSRVAKGYPTGEVLDVAYWQTLAAGNVIRDHATSQEHFIKWDRSMDGMRSLAQKGIDSLETRMAGLTYMALPDRFFRWQEDQPFSKLLEHAYDRRFARTANDYFCLVPGGAMEGDLVAILEGSDVPVIIRECGHEWQIVGTAYVHGVMYGEAYDEKKCKQFWFR